MAHRLTDAPLPPIPLQHQYRSRLVRIKVRKYCIGIVNLAIDGETTENRLKMLQHHMFT